MTDPETVTMVVPERFVDSQQLGHPARYIAQTYKHARNQAMASIARWNQKNPDNAIELDYKVKRTR